MLGIRERGVVISMNRGTAELDQTDEDFFCEVSDETLEAAAGAPSVAKPC